MSHMWPVSGLQRAGFRVPFGNPGNGHPGDTPFNSAPARRHRRKRCPKGVVSQNAPPGTTPPTDPGECTFLALDTASPYTAEFEGADAGKTAYYMLRWVTTRGEKGPWSETIAATISG
jgi:hypothetical protein